MSIQDRQKEAVARAFKRHNGALPDAPDGALLPEFNPQALARAIEQELQRCGVMGWTRMSIHMDLHDAVQLMTYLRKK